MVFSIRCLFGNHIWITILPGMKRVRYKDKPWWPMGHLFQDCICTRCGKFGKGLLLLPSEWDGEPITIDNNNSYGEIVDG
jgi:hypothetical protein